MRSLSEKQIEILTLICKGNPDGTPLDLDQLIASLSYKVKKVTLQFSIRYLIKRDLIERRTPEKRRGARRRILGPTLEGYTTYKDLTR